MGFGRLRDCPWEQLEQEGDKNVWHRGAWGGGQIVLRLLSRLTLGKANDLALQILPGEP